MNFGAAVILRCLQRSCGNLQLSTELTFTGVEVLLGSGKIETQPILPATTLRDSSMVKVVDDDVTTSGNNATKSSAGVRMRVGDDGIVGWRCLLPAWLVVSSALLSGW